MLFSANLLCNKIIYSINAVCARHNLMQLPGSRFGRIFSIMKFSVLKKIFRGIVAVTKYKFQGELVVTP